MSHNDQQALIAFLNLMLFGGIAWACLCRIAVMDDSARWQTRLGYSVAMATSLTVATMPAWGPWPDLGVLLAGVISALFIWMSRTYWGSGLPHHHRDHSKRRDEKPIPARWFLLPGVVVVAFMFPIIQAAILGPVQRNWTVTSWHTDGSDVVLRGTMEKWWGFCQWLPPTLAVDEYGEQYRVNTTNPSKGSNWGTLRAPVRYGPWRVVGGAGKRLTFRNTHSCNPFWNTTTVLGTLDTRRSTEKGTKP